MLTIQWWKEQREKVTFLAMVMALVCLCCMTMGKKNYGWSIVVGWFLEICHILAIVWASGSVFSNSNLLNFCRRFKMGWIEDSLWFALLIFIEGWVGRLQLTATIDIIFFCSLGIKSFIFIGMVRPQQDYGIFDTLLAIVFGCSKFGTVWGIAVVFAKAL